MPARPVGKRLKNWLIYRFIRSLIWMMRRLPRTFAIWFLERLAQVAYWTLRETRTKTQRHLRVAFGDQLSEDQVRATSRQVFLSLGRNAADALRLPQLMKDGLDRHVRFVGREHLDQAYARGNGVLCITGHLGCWELLAAAIARHYPLAVVGAELYDPRLNAMLVAEREKAGYKSFPRTSGGTRQILRWLKRGGLVGLLIDQDTRVDGEFVDFFGRPAKTPAGPIVLAERTGAALIPLAIRMNSDLTHTIEVGPEIHLQNSGDSRADRLANIEKLSKAVEGFISEYPTQWVWMHERWKTLPPAKNEVETG